MNTPGFAPIARTALAGQDAINGVVSVRELALSGKVTLRGDSDDAQFTSGLVPAEMAFPARVGERVEHNGVRVLCVGPDEWLLQMPLNRVEHEIERMQSAFAGLHTAVVDVSDYYTVLELAGVHTRDVLAKLTPLDVTSEAMPVGTSWRTRMAKCTVLLTIQSEHCARVQVRWSHAEYMRDYLAEAAREYNAPVGSG